MDSYVYTNKTLEQSKIYKTYLKHALILNLLPKEAPVLFYVGKGSMLVKFPYLMCTKDNVIIADPTKMLNSSKVLPIKSISSCTILTNKLGIPRISFGFIGSASVEFDPKFLSQPDAQKICSYILEIIKPEITPTVIINASSSNNYSDLEKLAELKEKGIISEEEFQLKKKKILDL